MNYWYVRDDERDFHLFLIATNVFLKFPERHKVFWKDSLLIFEKIPDEKYRETFLVKSSRYFFFFFTNRKVNERFNRVCATRDERVLSEFCIYLIFTQK